MTRLKNGSGRDSYDGSAALNMSALSDPEDSFPTAKRLRTVMPNDQEDPRAKETLAPDTEPTRTENPVPERRDALPPAAPPPAITPQEADSMFMAVVKDMTEAAAMIRADFEARRSFESQQLSLQNQVLAAIDRAERNGDANWKSTQHQIETWRKVDSAKNQEQDDKIAALEQRVAELEEKLLEVVQGELQRLLAPFVQDLEAIKTSIAELKAPNAPAPPAKAPAAPAE